MKAQRCECGHVDLEHEADEEDRHGACRHCWCPGFTLLVPGIPGPGWRDPLLAEANNKSIEKGKTT